MILVDTSVYISSLADSELETVLKKAGEKAFIISSEVVEQEMQEASDFLRKTNRRKDGDRLKEIYSSSVGGTIRLTGRVVRVAEGYSEKVKEKFGKSKRKIRKKHGERNG